MVIKMVLIFVIFSKLLNTPFQQNSHQLVKFFKYVNVFPKEWLFSYLFYVSLPIKIGIFKVFYQRLVQQRDKLNCQEESKRKSQQEEHSKKNLQQHLATESGSDNDDGDNESDLVPQAITPKKCTKK